MDFLILAAIGLVAGLLGGMLGVGGSIVMIPAMTEAFGPQQHLYQAAAMIVNFFVVVPAAILHWRAGAVMGQVVRRMAPLAVMAVVLGVLASEWPGFRGSGQTYLMIIFGVFIAYVASRHARILLRLQAETVAGRCFDPKRDGWRAGLLAGMPTGFAAGLLGIGGGTLCVPLQSRMLGVPLRSAIGNSATTIVMLSCIGAVSKNYALATRHPEYALIDSLQLAGALIPTAFLGSLIGSRLTHRLPLRALRLILVVFLTVAAVRMVQRGWSKREPSPPIAKRADSAPTPSQHPPNAP